MRNPVPALKTQVMQRITDASASQVWTPVDFLDLGGRDAVDKTLQRLVADLVLRRVDRGLYDRPQVNALTGKPTVPDYRSVIDAVGRRDQVRVLVDGMTAANDLGLTNAVPGQVIVHTDGRLRSIQLDRLTLQFKLTAPSKLYWAGRPAMRVVQALYWLRDGLKSGALTEQDAIRAKLLRLLHGSEQAQALQADLVSGLHTLPAWMQKWVRALMAQQAPSQNEA
jgi:hypothetical protein